MAGRENVTTQDVRNIQKSYNLDGILSQFYGLGPIWDDLRAILGPRECKLTFQGPFFEDLGSKRDPKWGSEITLEAARSPPEPPKCVLKRFFLDLRSHPNLAPRITTKMRLCRDVRHG